jgi:hypothetical protein
MVAFINVVNACCAKRCKQFPFQMLTCQKGPFFETIFSALVPNSYQLLHGNAQIVPSWAMAMHLS